MDLNRTPLSEVVQEEPLGTTTLKGLSTHQNSVYLVNSYQNHGRKGIMFNVLARIPTKRITTPVQCLLYLDHELVEL